MTAKIQIEKTVAVRVAEHLREDIISKRIKPNSHITIKEISEQYGTSNMPVREAFRILEGEKLLEMNAYKGATVQRIDKAFVSDIYGILRALEGLIYETAIPYIDEETLQRLRGLNDLMRQVAASGTDVCRSEHLRLNSEFHRGIIEYATNNTACDRYNYYHMLANALRKSYFPDQNRVLQSIEEHENLIQALEKKDVLALKVAVDTHSIHAMEDFFRQYKEDD